MLFESLNAVCWKRPHFGGSVRACASFQLSDVILDFLGKLVSLAEAKVKVVTDGRLSMILLRFCHLNSPLETLGWS